MFDPHNLYLGYEALSPYIAGIFSSQPLYSFDQWAFSLFPNDHMKESCSAAGPEEGSWLLTPTHYIMDASVFVFLFIYFVRRRLNMPSPLSSNTSMFSRTPSNSIYFLIPLVLSISLILFHKILGSKLIFLVQPCHIFHLIMIFTLFLSSSNQHCPANPSISPKNSNDIVTSANTASEPDYLSLGDQLFNSFFNLLYVPFLGLALANTKAYNLPLEYFNWIFQHLLLLIVPFYLAYTRRFKLVSSPALFFEHWVWISIYHYVFLSFASLYSNTNINFMLCPPKMTALNFFGILGPFWRIPGFILGILAAFAWRFILIEGLIKLIMKFSPKPKVSTQKLE
jgi:hypothetical protein